MNVKVYEHLAKIAFKRIYSAFSFFSLTTLLGLTSCSDDGKQKTMSLSDSLAYCQGIYTGWTLREAGYHEYNEKLLLQGYGVSLKNKTVADSVFRIASEKLYTYLKDGERLFFEGNKKKEGVIQTKSGLQYKVIKEGTGAKPMVGDSLLLSYIGKRMDGLAFTQKSQSIRHGELFTGNLPGLREGIGLMRVGSRYTFYLPSKLGHGKLTMGPPLMYDNMVMIFEIELYDIIAKNKS